MAAARTKAHAGTHDHRNTEYHPDGKEYGKPEPGLMVPVNGHEEASLPARIFRSFWAQPPIRSRHARERPARGHEPADWRVPAVVLRRRRGRVADSRAPGRRGANFRGPCHRMRRKRALPPTA